MDAGGAISMFHPATRIAVWILFAAGVAMARWQWLVAFGLLLAAWLGLTRPPNLLPMVRRARWLLLSLVLVYALATPGAGLHIWEGGPGFSHDGLSLGLVQAGRIVLMIGALALLLAATPADELVVGLWVLLRPLAPLGLDPQRVALRLALTLEYAQRRGSPRRGDWRNALVSALEPESGTGTPVRLARIPFSWRDGAAVGAALLIFALGLV
jgi:energy-coupling factor transporter transmembrane protein EcfT